MEQHKGKIVENAIKKSGYQMKALAKKLGIARNTLYVRLRDEDLEDGHIIAIGAIIHYDFSIDFPYLKPRIHKQDAKRIGEDGRVYYSLSWYENLDFIQLRVLNIKYVQLLEDYSKLLKILILLANSNELMGVKKEISEFVENEAKS